MKKARLLGAMPRQAGLFFMGSKVSAQYNKFISRRGDFYPLTTPANSSAKLYQILRREPKQYNPNLLPIGHGFGFIVFIEEVEDW